MTEGGAAPASAVLTPAVLRGPAPPRRHVDLEYRRPAVAEQPPLRCLGHVQVGSHEERPGHRQVWTAVQPIGQPEPADPVPGEAPAVHDPVVPDIAVVLGLDLPSGAGGTEGEKATPGSAGALPVEGP